MQVDIPEEKIHDMIIKNVTQQLQQQQQRHKCTMVYPEADTGYAV